MLSNSQLAVIPKARAIFARRISPAEYTELMRRRSVPEVAQFLKNHPYFKTSLKTLSETAPHRSQLEELLSKDIFFKYESLMRYCTNRKGFGHFFIFYCEINELLEKFRLLSVGSHDQYITHLPAFLVNKTSVDLIKLAKASDFTACIKVLAATPYAKLLTPFAPTQQQPHIDYLALEHVLKTYYYKKILGWLDQYFSGAEAKQLKVLFQMEAEIYNLDLIFRIKAFFNESFTPEQIEDLLLPVYFRLNRKKLLEFANAKSVEAFTGLYESSKAAHIYGSVTPQGISGGQKSLTTLAKRILRFTSMPEAALAAILTLAKVERDNIINIIEGVRYGMPPEKIDQLIEY